MAGKLVPVAVRFWPKVQKTDGCWLWAGAHDQKGYGRIHVGGRSGQTILTHRIAWELTFGLVPEGRNVLHRCDNPPCVRPDHLFLGSKADNSQDMVMKGRHWAQTRPEVALRGEAIALAKLTDDAVREIRRLHAIYRETDQWTLARRFGVSQRLIWRIVSTTDISAGLTRLGAETVAEIRRLYTLHRTTSEVALAQRFGVKQAAISKVLCGATWKHVAAYVAE